MLDKAVDQNTVPRVNVPRTNIIILGMISICHDGWETDFHWLIVPHSIGMQTKSLEQTQSHNQYFKQHEKNKYEHEAIKSDIQ